MRILGMIVMGMCVGVTTASAATVDLTDGRVVQGNIISQDTKSLQINVDGVNMTYYADEIKDVDGQPFTATASQPSAPASQPEPAVQPEAAASPDTSTPTDTSGEPGSIDPEKKALILKFIDVFGTRQALINNFDLMLAQIEKEKPEEAQKIRQRVKVDEIIDHLLPIYDRNFTSDDLKAFIAFYSSPEGQKLISTIPELMKESVSESVKYMEEKFPEVKQGQ